MHFTSLKRLLSELMITITFVSICVPVLASTEQATPIQKKLAALETTFDGRIGIYAVDTRTNQTIQYRAMERFPIQSTFKMMAVAAILKKSMTNNRLLQERVTYTKQDLVVWSPITEKHVAGGMTISELCAAAMMYSDNAATNLLVKKLGGPEAVTAFARSIGDNIFRIDSWEPKLNSNPNDIYDTSTPLAMGKSLKKLAFGNILSPSQRELLVTWMKGNITGDTRIRAGVPKGWIVADKTGASDNYGISNDIGIVWPPNAAPIVVVIYSVHHKKNVTRRRDDLVASATKILINEFAQK